MAIVTVPRGDFLEYDAGGNVVGQFRAEYDYDDTTLKVVTGRAINTTSKPGRVVLVRTSDQFTVTIDCPAGQTLTGTVPTSGGGAFPLTVLPSGKLNGCGVNVVWPSA